MNKILKLSGILFLIICVISGIYVFITRITTDVKIYPVKKRYMRWEFIELNAVIKNKKLREEYKTSPFFVHISRDNENVVTVGNVEQVSMRFDEKKNLWVGKWPCPWAAPVGRYAISASFSEDISVSAEDFLIFARKRKKLDPEIFGVLTFENAAPVDKLGLRSPAGAESDWKTLFDWTEFVGADAFWYLAGQTKAESASPDETFPWRTENISKLSQMGAEAHKRGQKFGAYLIAYLTFGKYKYKNYSYACDYSSSEKGVVETSAVSLGDEKRVSDIIEFVKLLNECKEVDYIGMDYIRNAFGGYELVEEFISDMDIPVPVYWTKLSYVQKISWFANEKISAGNKHLVEQWYWWRAHKVSSILHRITTEVKLKKPLWVFTLSWEKGWHHGQDPVMFSDAGADIISVMIYEATRKQLDYLLKGWNAYVSTDDVNLAVGNVVDWPLHQRTLNPAGPEEFYNRLVKSVEQIYKDGKAKGVFIHDLQRALKGRKEPYSSKEWLLAGSAAITTLKKEHSVFPFDIKINVLNNIRRNEEFDFNILIENISGDKHTDIGLSVILPDGIITGIEKENIIEELSPGAHKTIKFKGIIRNSVVKKGGKSMIAVRVDWKGKNWTVFDYYDIK
ncbi:MAG: hypothetical protein BWY26_00176 [Elusimicrobia bacterium ADurb.Bin231]|nr:MAG: hypothetical protein BWY26_00176 [Elusimicrobia bacterium ADurb.Bin231]